MFRGFVGGRGAGKTFIGVYDLLRRARKGRTYMVASPTSVMMKDTTYPSFMAMADELTAVDSVRLTPYPNVTLGNGAVIRFRTAEDPDKMRGPNLSGCWLDEASLMSRDAYTVAIAALREAGEQGWLSATFTPKGKTHWTYDVFATGKPNTAIFHATTRDNPFNPEGFHETVAAQYAGLEEAQELGGEFLDPEGAEWPDEYFEGEELRFDYWPSGQEARALVTFLDPSKSRDSKSGDYAAFIDLMVTRDGLLWIDAELVKAPAERIVETAVEHQRQFRPHAFGIETNQFQQLFALLFEAKAAQAGIMMPLVEVTNHTAKDVRIRRIGPYLKQRRCRFRRSPGCDLLLSQLRAFPNGEHDDGPDALEGAIRIAAELLGGD